MNRFCRILWLFLYFPAFSQAQQDSIQEVQGIPTKQIFDLMTDSRGFLWVGHDLGLSRYDGKSFTHYSCPQQNSLGLGDVLEDPQGRIWCRNFSSQVFYLENEKMKLLPAYDFKNEPRFPRLVMIGNKLVATSSKGLFVCNTATMQTQYIKCPSGAAGGKGVSTTTLCTWRDKVIAFSSDNFKLYLYDPTGNTGPSELIFDYSAREAEDISLQPFGYHDTLYSFSPRTGMITKLMLNGNKVIMAGKVKSKGFLYTINPSGNDTWIHMKEQSESIGHTGQPIAGYEITDLVTDKEGNTWYSSFKYGLMVKLKSRWNKFSVPGIGEKEIIVRMDRVKQFNIIGTNSTKIIVQDAITNKIIRSFQLPDDIGTIQNITTIDSERVIIATALRIYILKDNCTVLENVLKEGSYLSLKSVVLQDSSLFMATATGLNVLREIKDSNGKKDYELKLINTMRCRWVSYNKNTNTLLVAFKDGLSEYRDGKFIPILFNREPVSVVAMQDFGHQFYISTFGKDLLTYDGSGIKKTSILDKYNFYPVNQIKTRNDTTWLLGTGFIVLFNPVSGKIYKDIVIPSFPNANIYDLSWIRGEPVLLTSLGTFALKTSKPDSGYILKNYLLKTVVNGRDTLVQNGVSLHYYQNSLDFYIGVPFYTNAENIYFKYRLKRSGNEEWKLSTGSSGEFRFSSLSPGQYIFEAQAVHPQFGTAMVPISFAFTIRPPWYQTTLFRIILVLLVAGILTLFVIVFFKFRLRKQKMDFEKQLAIRNERERISAEIHDDIGAGLSGVRLLTELTGIKSSEPEVKDDLDKIYSSITELSGKMKEVVWSLNSSNDQLEHLLRYIEQQAKELLQYSPVKLRVQLPDNIPSVQIGSERRTDVYLAVKEALHNTLRHSGATEAELVCRLEQDLLLITVRDNGKGITAADKTGNGMLNIRKRIERLQGALTVKNHQGLTLEFVIPLNSNT